MSDKLNQLIALEPKSPANGAAYLNYYLIDGSQSMRSKWWNFLTAADIIREDVAKSGLDSHLIVQVFDSIDINMVQRDGAISSAPPLQNPPIGSHWGSTPLYDAISIMASRLRDLNPARASILIVTDGQDNASHMDVVQAKSFLDWIKAMGWQVTFLGVDFNNFRQASALGMTEAQCIGVNKENLNKAASAYSGKAISYGRTGKSTEFTDAERQQFGGFLSSGSGK